MTCLMSHDFYGFCELEAGHEGWHRCKPGVSKIGLPYEEVRWSDTEVGKKFFPKELLEREVR